MIKKSKKIFSIFMVVILLVCCLSVFTACKKKGGDNSGGDTTPDPVAITESMISLEYSSVVYDRTEKCPTVVLKNGEATIEASQYSVVYENNTNVGTAKVKVLAVEGSTVVSGSAETTFEITIAEIPDVQPMSYALYNNAEQVPNVLISGLSLDDYDIIWEYKSLTDEDSAYQTLNKQENHFIQAGHYRLTVTGKGNYEGTKTAVYSIYYPFGDIVLASDDFIEEEGHRYEFNYDGDQHFPEISISGLVKDTDYELSYAYKPVGATEFSNYNFNAETDASSFTTAGEYKVIATGKGIYAGQKEAVFKINALSLDDVTFTISSDTVYDKTSKTPTYTVGSLTENESFIATWQYRRFTGEFTNYTLNSNPSSNFINAGEYKLTISGRGNYEGTKTAIYTIARASLTATIYKNDYIYNGDKGKFDVGYTINLAQNPKHKAYYAKGVFASVDATDTWAEYSLELDLDAGTYSIYAVTEPMGNYDSTTTAISTFVVMQDELKGLLNLAGREYTYDGSSYNPNFVISSNNKSSGLVEGVDYELAWTITDGTGTRLYTPDKDHPKKNFVDAGYYEVTLYAKGNYTISDPNQILTKTGFEITPANFDSFSVSRVGYAYGTTPTEIVINGGTGVNGVKTLNATITYQVRLSTSENVDSSWITITKDTVLDAGSYIIKAKASGAKNYNVLETTGLMTTNNLFVVSDGTLVSGSYYINEESLSSESSLKVTSSNGDYVALLSRASVKYYYYVSGSAGEAQELQNLSSLEAGSYKIYAIISGIKNYNDFQTATVSYTVADKNA